MYSGRMQEAVEAQGLLLWTQMGARKRRSTLSAISLITSSVQAAWQAHLKYVVSILSLDISGAFDYMSHERLLWILRKKGLLKWMIKFI